MSPSPMGLGGRTLPNVPDTLWLSNSYFTGREKDEDDFFEK